MNYLLSRDTVAGPLAFSEWLESKRNSRLVCRYSLLNFAMLNSYH